MALLKSVKLQFNKSNSPDIGFYKLYAQSTNDSVGVNYNSPSFNLGMPEFDENGVAQIDLSSIPGMNLMDGTYNLGITAVDDAGNESAMLTTGLEGIQLDFVAPDPPTAASIIYGN